MLNPNLVLVQLHLLVAAVTCATFCGTVPSSIEAFSHTLSNALSLPSFTLDSTPTSEFPYACFSVQTFAESTSYPRSIAAVLGRVALVDGSGTTVIVPFHEAARLTVNVTAAASLRSSRPLYFFEQLPSVEHYSLIVSSLLAAVGVVLLGTSVTLVLQSRHRKIVARSPSSGLMPHMIDSVGDPGHESPLAQATTHVVFDSVQSLATHLEVPRQGGLWAELPALPLEELLTLPLPSTHLRRTVAAKLAICKGYINEDFLS